MKRYSRCLVAILLAVTLALSTYSISYATIDGDPVGHCSHATHEYMIRP